MSSFVSFSPQALDAASQDLTGIGWAIRSADAAAASSTTQVAAAGQDEVSAAIAGVFRNYALEYQALITQAGLFHDQFAQALRTGSGTYAATEAASTSTMLESDLALARSTAANDVDLMLAQMTTMTRSMKSTISKDERLAQTTAAKDLQIAAAKAKLASSMASKKAIPVEQLIANSFLRLFSWLG